MQLTYPSDGLLSALAPLTPITGCGPLVAHVAADVFGLWDRWEHGAGAECPIPYWAVVWPGAIAVARYILAHPALVAGKRVLDLGCGGGFAGISAARAGARTVSSNDTDPVALHLASRNSYANRETILLDNRDYLNNPCEIPLADVVLAADLFYERSTAASMLQLLHNLRRAGALVLVADGERAFAPQDECLVLAREKLEVNKELEGKQFRTVRLSQLTNS